MKVDRFCSAEAQAAGASRAPAAPCERGRLAGRPRRRALGRGTAAIGAAQPGGLRLATTESRWGALEDATCRLRARARVGNLTRMPDASRTCSPRVVRRCAPATRRLRPSSCARRSALWRGRPFEDAAYEQFTQVEAARLEALRLACLEERVEADLARGEHAGLVAELETAGSAPPAA